MSIRLVPPSYRLFPYERELAERELVALGLEEIERSGDEIVARRCADSEALARLTYVERIELADGTVARPDLAAMEAVHRVRRDGLRNRQATRYHLHGIHEYKGRFNPQVVRSFANLVGLRPGDWLVDPFCGSGTSLVEGLSMEANVLGIDRSPMAALLSRAKLAALRSRRPGSVAVELERWCAAAAPAIRRAQRSERVVERGLGHLSHGTHGYLSRWYTPAALAGVSAALAGWQSTRGTLRLLAATAISAIARETSLQLPEDLRIRKRPPGFVAPPVEQALIDAVARIAAGLREAAAMPRRSRGRAVVRHGSADRDGEYRALAGRSTACAVITSPPYATALPYIDTDRLSIVLLGLASADDIRALERDLIGSREWTTAQRRAWREALDSDRHDLPPSAVELCRRVERDRPATAGFRRDAVAPLLYRYFTAMGRTFTTLAAQLRSGESAVYVVGGNRTSGSDGDVEIPTPALLADIAERAGFELRESIPLETWPRFGLNHANGIGSESAVWLTRR